MHKAHESRVRRLAKREGYVVRKSRRYRPPDVHTDYMLVDASSGVPAVGYRYDATLDEIEQWLRQ